MQLIGNPRRIYLALIVVWLLLMSPAIYYYYQQSVENDLLADYLGKIHLAPASSAWEKSIAVSQGLRRDFEIDEDKFKVLDMSDRPFLRESSAKLLEIKEGVCGEGTRVLVNLLILAGYDATRLSLYDRYLNSSHTLVSLMVDGEEYLVDSINTPDYTNNLLNANQINAASFNIVKYSGDVTARMAELKQLRQQEASDQDIAANEPEDPIRKRFFERFKYYSYEAIPYTKLFSVVGLNVRLLNFDRPPVFLSSLAEKPSLIMSIFFGLLATATVFILWLLARFTLK